MMKKNKVRKSKTIYYPEFTSFQKLYLKLQRGVSFTAALAGSIILMPLFP
ncbi:hypothetical protein [Sellimonas sp.]